MASLRSAPPYEALSYTWGDTTERRTIRLKSKSISWHDLPVTDNLSNALRRLRWRFKIRTLWIDAICINQRNVTERSRQVSFMDEVYKSTQSVLIWLGEPKKEDLRFRLWGPGREAKAMISAIDVTVPRWSERAWVIQEFLHGRKRIICAGRVCRVYDAEEFSKRFRHGSSTMHVFLGRLEAMEGIKSSQANALNEGYLHLHRVNSDPNGALEAADPRDMIYSMLSFMTSEQVRLIGSDYNVPCCQVYAKATYASMCKHENLHALRCAGPWTSWIEGLPT